MRTAVAITTVGLLVLVGCQSSDEPQATCEELQPLCFERQSICVDDPSGARCQFCPMGMHATAEGACSPISGTSLSNEFMEFTVGPGEEIIGLCQSWTLNNPEALWIQSVEMRQDERSHHSIWTYSPNSEFDGPDGVWPCDERNYSNIQAAIKGGVLYAQSTQSTEELQRFPNGAAIRIPPYSRIIGDVHLLNTTSQSVTGSIEITLYSIPEEDVEIKLTPFELEMQEVMVPARSTSRLVANCDLRPGFERAAQVPVDFDVYYALPHAHERARRLFIDVEGGPMDGTSILNDRHYATFEPRGVSYDDPIQVRGASGLRFGCEYENRENRDYVWGLNQEMCQFLLYVQSPVGLSAFTNSLGAVQDVDGMQEFAAPDCQVLAIPWDHDRPGGEPPATTP